ncbi:MAG: hypothetical protein EOO23_05105 [Comamonadaceae bacterium]|nr:MAG: hypothetical protein EOO23_05105 [Comamonadaceae bacterium]
MINLRLASEYLASPIFCGDLEKMGHIEVGDLPISKKLMIKIIEWDAEFQATFNDEYPPDSGFCSSDARRRHMAAGEELAQEIQQELGGGYAVKYFR